MLMVEYFFRKILIMVRSRSLYLLLTTLIDRKSTYFPWSFIACFEEPFYRAILVVIIHVTLNPNKSDDTEVHLCDS